MFYKIFYVNSVLQQYGDDPLTISSWDYNALGLVLDLDIVYWFREKQSAPKHILLKFKN